MRFTLLVGMMLLCTGQAFATVGGGVIPLKNKGGDVLFSHETHVSGASQKCTASHDKVHTNSRQHKKVTMKGMQKGKSCGVSPMFY